MIALSIAGSDPSGGAGIQADLKTFTALGVYGLTVVSAITSQNTSKFSKVNEVSSDMVQSQIESVLSDFKINVIKIGMVYSSSTIKAIHSELKNTKIPIILDPVFESTTGGALLQNEAFSLFKKLLVPLSFVITPNLPEAERLAGIKIRTLRDVKVAAAKIRRIGAENIVIKGGHFDGKTMTDYVFEKTKFYSFSSKRINRTTHGGGCNFSASLAANIAKGNNLKDSINLAKEFSFKSIANSQKIGRGIFVSGMESDEMKKELSDAISKFTNLKNVSKYIPEVQTNFVFARKNPKSLNDVLGVSGRIVKVENSAVVAGIIKYGGSRHVGSAVLEMVKKFPAIRSCINIKYDKEFIKKAILKKLSVSHYERKAESSKTRTKEGNTISWGIKNAIKSSKHIDLIFHKGDIGKEPMIMIFGTTPNAVLDKLTKIIG